MVNQKRMDLRHSKLTEINFKYLANEFSHAEKNNFLEHNIEDAIRHMGQCHSKEQQKHAKFI